MSKSYLLKILLVISDKTTKKEIHSETVGVSFYNQESKYIRGQDKLSYYDHPSIEHYLRLNTVYNISTVDIFRTNNQKARYEGLMNCINRLHVGGSRLLYDTVVIEEIVGTEEEIRQQVKDLVNDPGNVIWRGEFV